METCDLAAYGAVRGSFCCCHGCARHHTRDTCRSVRSHGHVQRAACMVHLSRVRTLQTSLNMDESNITQPRTPANDSPFQQPPCIYSAITLLSEVSVMEGGMPAWKELNLPLETSLVSDDTMAAPAMAARADPPPPAAYLAKLDSSKIRSRDDMLHNVNSKEAIVVDARSAGRFVGTEPEPRAGLKSGHIPGARNIPFPQVLDEGCKFKSVDELKAVFSAAGVNVDGQQPLVGSCGSGLTACVLALAVFKATGNLKQPAARPHAVLFAVDTCPKEPAYCLLVATDCCL
eukprot:355524-Chlamydomonas_euryale.AAC.41